MISSHTKQSRLDWVARAALLVALAMPCGGAFADDTIPTLPDAQVKTLVEQIDADPSVTMFFQMCPADAYRRRTDLTGNLFISPETCGRNPTDCLAQCLTAASGHHCFTLARILQDAKNTSPLYGEKLFQIACVTGNSAGCVNRGSGMRNRKYANDPFVERPKTERDICEVRSFKIGCDDRGSWGCAMLGQAYAKGEGTASDAEKAEEAYDKACRISPHFAACDFAERNLAAMKNGGSTPKPDAK